VDHAGHLPSRCRCWDSLEAWLGSVDPERLPSYQPPHESYAVMTFGPPPLSRGDILADRRRSVIELRTDKTVPLGLVGKLLLVNPGSGSPEWLPLEAWRVLDGPNVLLAPGDPLAERLSEAGMAFETLPEAAPDRLAAPAAAAPPQPARAELRLIQPHAHGSTTPRLAALADRLASIAIERGTAAFVLPSGGEPIVRAVLERALRGDVEIEVVIGRAPRGHRMLDLVRVMTRLRGPDGCPWDREQTHETLLKYLIDETYELIEAVERGDDAHVAEELGDLLLQVVFHAQMGTDAGTFDIDDVADSIVRKLIRRHPHVFGNVEVSGAEEVVANWDVIKRHEKERSSALEGVPDALPALAYAAKLLRRAGKAAAHGAEDRFASLAGITPDEAENEIGELLMSAVALARGAGVDAETSLRKAARRFADRIARVEANAGGRALDDLTDDELGALWSGAGEPQA
jgi:MazG family protein